MHHLLVRFQLSHLLSLGGPPARACITQSDGKCWHQHHSISPASLHRAHPACRDLPVKPPAPSIQSLNCIFSSHLSSCHFQEKHGLDSYMFLFWLSNLNLLSPQMPLVTLWRHPQCLKPVFFFFFFSFVFFFFSLINGLPIQLCINFWLNYTIYMYCKFHKTAKYMEDAEVTVGIF